MSKVTIASVIRAYIVQGCTTEQILTKVKELFPDSNTSAACVAYYRSKAKKEGKLPAKKAAEAPKAEAPKVPALNKPMLPIYTAKNIVTFNGMEGGGFNASLYRDGKRVAYVIDDASGGDIIVDWLDKEKAEWEVTTHSGEVITVKGTAEEKFLMDYLKTLPPMETNFVGSDGEDVTLDWNIDLFVSEIVNAQITFNKMKKDMKKNVFYIGKDGHLMRMKCEGNAKVYEQLRTRFQASIIFNELGDEQLMAEIKKL